MSRHWLFAGLLCSAVVCATGCGSTSTAPSTTPILSSTAGALVASPSAAGTAATATPSGISSSTPSTSSGSSSSSSSAGTSADTDDRELEGLITAVPPTTPAKQFAVDGVLVTITDSTTITLNGHTGLVTDLVVGARVHVKAAASTTPPLIARVVMIQNQAPAPPTTTPGTTGGHDDDDADDDGHGGSQVELSGTIVTASGTCPALRLTIGTKVVTTTSSTRFDLACTSLVPGRAVEVTGTVAADGVVTATRVTRK